MEISALSQARSNTVSKLLNAPDFAALLIEHGWAAFPDRFLKAVANSKDTTTQTLIDWPIFARWVEQLAVRCPQVRDKTPPFRTFGDSEFPAAETSLYDTANSLFQFNRSLALNPLTPPLIQPVPI